MKCKLTLDNVLVRKLPQPKTGVYVPDSVQENYVWVEVVDSGAGRYYYDTFISNGIKAGDKVLVHSSSVDEMLSFKLNDESVYLLTGKDIFAVQD